MIKSSGGGRDIVVRWRMLAAQRLSYLTDLHETGRWKLYHREPAFLEMIKETREALDIWESIAPSDAVRDHTQIDPTEADDAVEPHGQPLVRWPLPDGVGADHDLRET